jgi:hypothetical protein
MARGTARKLRAANGSTRRRRSGRGTRTLPARPGASASFRPAGFPILLYMQIRGALSSWASTLRNTHVEFGVRSPSRLVPCRTHVPGSGSCGGAGVHRAPDSLTSYSSPPVPRTPFSRRSFRRRPPIPRSRPRIVMSPIALSRFSSLPTLALRLVRPNLGPCPGNATLYLPSSMSRSLRNSR